MLTLEIQQADLGHPLHQQAVVMLLTVCSVTYTHGGWQAVVFICLALLIIPLSTGLKDRKISRNSTCD